MTKTELKILKRALKSLSFVNLDPALKPHADALKIYLDTWVRPLIQGVIDVEDGKMKLDDISFWVKHQ